MSHARKRAPTHAPKARSDEGILRELVEVQCGCDCDNVTARAEFGVDIPCDSLDFIELVMTAEERFDIVIDEAAAEGVKTFGDFVKLVTQTKGQPRVPRPEPDIN